jgi:hypothetical protein
MKKSFYSILIVLMLLTMSMSAQAQTAAPQPVAAIVVGTGFTYQGQLKDGAGSSINDSCDFIFRLWDSKTIGAQIGADDPVTGVEVTNGTFSAKVNSASEFGASAFTGNARWLEISLRCPDKVGDYTTLSPRQELTPAPYASYATRSAIAPWSGLTGIPADIADGDNDTTYTAGTGLSLSSGAFSVTFAGTGIANTAARSDHTHSNYWRTIGNSQTDPATNFIGTMDDYPLIFRVNNQRALRLEPNATSPNIIGGYSGNSVTSGRAGATIGGGGKSDQPNSVINDFGFVGGGSNNSVSFYAAISGGNQNQANGSYSFVGGGFKNSGSGQNSAIAGGDNNFASSAWASIGGGVHNTATAFYATVSGGAENDATGEASAVGGGDSNQASGDYATVPGGKDALASSYGQQAYASGLFADKGDAQTALYVLRNTTTDNVWTKLYLDGESLQIVIPRNHARTFDIMIIGYSSVGNAAGYRIQGLCRHTGATVEFVGTPSITVLGEDISSWDADITWELSTLVIRVKGATGQTVRWVANVQTAEVVFP